MDVVDGYDPLPPGVVHTGAMPDVEPGTTWITGDQRDDGLGTWVYLEPGTFMMGSAEDEIGRRPEETRHEVTLTRPFWMQTLEITQAQHEALLGSNPSTQEDCDTCPVETVTWYGAVALANAASEMLGLPPCVELTDCRDVEGYGWVCDRADVPEAYATILDCPGVRLPTEAEWEYAARDAGTVTDAIPGGGNVLLDDKFRCEPDVRLDDGSLLADRAWFCGSAPKERITQRVGAKEATSLDLHDISGNVFEWMWDRHAPHPSTSVVDPTGPEAGVDHIVKGGSTGDEPFAMRAALRANLAAADSFQLVGLRLVRTAR